MMKQACPSQKHSFNPRLFPLPTQQSGLAPFGAREQSESMPWVFLNEFLHFTPRVPKSQTIMTVVSLLSPQGSLGGGKLPVAWLGSGPSKPPTHRVLPSPVCSQRITHYFLKHAFPVTKGFLSSPQLYGNINIQYCSFWITFRAPNKRPFSLSTERELSQMVVEESHSSVLSDSPRPIALFALRLAPFYCSPYLPGDWSYHDSLPIIFLSILSVIWKQFGIKPCQGFTNKNY